MRRIVLVLTMVALLSVMVLPTATAQPWRGGGFYHNDHYYGPGHYYDDDDDDYYGSRYYDDSCDWYWSWFNGWEYWCWSPWFGWYQLW
jgi:hypothetical protein